MGYSILKSVRIFHQRQPKIYQRCCVVHSGYKFVLRLLVLIFHEKINKLCTVEINQTFLHHLSISFARRNDDEHPVILLVPEAPTFGGFFYDRKKPQNVGASGTRSITENPVIKPILSLMVNDFLSQKKRTTTWTTTGQQQQNKKF